MALTASTMLRRGLRRRCPVCGQGHLFHHWVSMAPECPTCGLHFERAPGHWLGSWFLNVCLVQAVIVVVLVIGVAATYPASPMPWLAAVTVAAAVIVPLAFFPISRTLWSAIDLAMQPLDFDDGVAPGFELADDVERVRRSLQPPA